MQLALNAPAKNALSHDRLPNVAVQLEALNVPPREADAGQLTLKDGDTTSTLQVSTGETVEINSNSYEVRAIRPWEGLLHRAPGLLMLNMAVRPPDADWIENLFVQHGGARIVTPEIAVLARDSDTEAASSPARWGVVEDDRVHWFSSFVPGTGLELGDGSIVTLLARQPSARILVETIRNDAASEIWVDANRYQPDGPIRYEDPSAVAYQLEIDSMDDNSITVSMIEGDLEHWTQKAELGAILIDKETGIWIRVDQHESNALPILADESPWLEVVLANPERVLRIREGEAVRIGEYSTTFEAIANPQPAQVEILVGGESVSFSAETVYTHGTIWLDQLRVLNASAISLDVTETNRRTPLRLCLTALLVVVALIVEYRLQRRA